MSRHCPHTLWVMKKRYSYRAYPTGGQQQSLARLFGCVRRVCKDGSGARETAYREKTGFISAGELQKPLITQAKKTPEREWLAERSNVPLQQSVRDAARAYRNCFDSISGKRKGPKVGKPRFKSRRAHRQSARFHRGVVGVGQPS